MRVALVHYWLVGMAGGERVLEALCRMYPQADIFTHVLDRRALSPDIAGHHIETTFINRLPGSRKQYQRYLPLMPLALEQLDLTGYDLVISSESGPAKGVITRADSLHVCYCHTPMRYLWDTWPDYMASAGALTRLGMRLLLPGLRRWDLASSFRVDHFVANSRTVARRIRKHWRREAAVVYPPVHIAAFTARERPGGEFYLCLGRLTHYKRVDLAVKACSRLNRPLVVVGKGEALKALQAEAAPCVRFLGRQDDVAVADLLARSKALLFPGEEDFGIVPLEAAASGTPYWPMAGAAPRKRYATALPDSFSRNRVWRQWKPPFWSSNAGSGILTPSYCAVTPRASARSASDRNSRGRWNWRGRRKAVRRKFNKRHSRKAPPARFCPESTNPSRPTSC